MVDVIPNKKLISIGYIGSLSLVSTHVNLKFKTNSEKEREREYILCEVEAKYIISVP